MNRNKPIPPTLATRLLHTFLRDDLLEEVSGDLEEKFYRTVEGQSLLRAKMNYWYEVLNYVRPFALRKSKSVHINRYAMFQNYFKITTRSLLNQKLYSVINIGGLSLGLTCFLIILLYVQHEFSYNRFYENADHIYRVYQKQEGNVSLGTDYFAVTPAKLATVMREEIPHVKYATSIEQSSGLLSREENHYFEKGLAGDDQFFKVLPMQFIQGNADKALADPNSIILIRSLAEKIFGDQDPIGQSVRYQNDADYTVTAIVNDPPLNSSLEYTFIINILYNPYYAEELKKTGWSNNAHHTFFVLDEDADPKEVEAKFPALLKKYQLPEDYGNYPFKDQYFVQPISEIYFQSNVNSDIGLKGSRDAVKTFSLVALIVLVLACVNYMNLAVARSIKRSREVGLRKVVGAMRRQLIIQFLGESVLITFLSLLLAVGLTYLILPYFGRLMERPIDIDFLSNPLLLTVLFLLVVVVGLFSGSYPALVMSSLRPVEVLKAKVNVKLSGFSLQRALIIFQFAASITLVVSSLVIYRQLQFMQEKELGYDKNDIVTMRVRDLPLQDKFELLANEWKQHSGVKEVTLVSNLPSNITSSTIVNSKPGENEKTGFTIYRLYAEYSFLKTFGVELVTGRNFLKENNEEKSYLINETAARALGWTLEEAIGKEFYQDGPKTIIGVVKDFHMHSMHLPIQPLMIQLSDRGNYFSIKINHENVPATLAAIEKTFRKHSPYPFEYQFMEDNFRQLYQSEMKLGEIFGFFTLISVLIASLGLFGLAAFLSAQRTKEIGVRKVLGASVQSIVVLLSKDFLKLVLIAFVIAIPVGWYAMDIWLQDFAYRINIGWWIFAIAGMLAFVVANLSVGYQSLKASWMDPVDSLRSE